jgi:pimeloyl-ACP methyl ester carboxylesterase
VTSEQAAAGSARVVPVEFAGPATHILRGLRFGASRQWAVLVHGEGQDLDVWRPLSGWLADRDFCVLAFDLPGHGASDDPWEPALTRRSVIAAVEFARSEGSRQVHLIGAGVGALGCLATAAQGGSPPASIVAFSPKVDARVANLAEVREARAPKLILVGSLDEDAVEDAEAVYRAAIGHCELTRFPVATQGAELLAGEWGSHAREKVLAHLTRPK